MDGQKVWIDFDIVAFSIKIDIIVFFAENLKMVIFYDEFKYSIIEINMLGSLKMMQENDNEYTLGLIERNMSDNGKMMKVNDNEHSLGLIEGSMSDSLKMV